MKKPLLIICLCLSVFFARAQDTLMHQYIKLHYTGLDTSYLSTGILYDRAFPLSNIDFFNGRFDTVNNYHNWRQMYMEIGNAAYDTTFLPSIDVLSALARDWSYGDTIPLGLLHIKFDKVKYWAVDSGLIEYDTLHQVQLSIQI